MNPLLSTSPVVVSLFWMFLSPNLRMSSILSDVDSISVPPRISPISESLESKSSKGSTFLDFPLKA